MGLFSGFERKMEDTVEGGAGRMFSAPITPVQIAKKAEREMQREKMVGAGKQFAPTLYTVLVSQADDERLFGYYPTLAGETETYLAAKASSEGLSMDGSPLVRFIVDDGLKRGKFEVIAELVAAPIVEQLRAEEMARYGIITPEPSEPAGPTEEEIRAQVLRAAQGGFQGEPEAAAFGNSGGFDPVYSDGRYSDYDEYGYDSYDDADLPYTEYTPSTAYAEYAQADYAQAQVALAQTQFEPEPNVDPAPIHSAVSVPIQAPELQFTEEDRASLSFAASSRGFAEAEPIEIPESVSKAASVALPADAGFDAPIDYTALEMNSETFERLHSRDVYEDPERERREFAAIAAEKPATELFHPEPNVQRGSVIPTAATAMRTQLLPAVLLDDARRISYPLRQTELVIGRDTGCDIIIPDTSVSRVHAALTCINAKYWVLRDLDSTNGTLVNGSLINEIPLRKGDRITIGTSKLRYEEL